MRKFLLVSLGLVIVSVSASAYIIYTMLLTAKLTSNPSLEPTSTPILELLKIEANEDGSFTVYVRNNYPQPSDGFTPPSQRIRVGTVIVYDQNDQAITSVGSYQTTASPQTTVSWTGTMTKMNPDGRKVVVPLEIGYSIVVMGLTETEQEVFSNKVVFNR